MWPTHGGPLGPLGPLGAPWGPMGPPWGPMGPMGPLGPHGPQVRLLLCGAISKSSQKLAFPYFWGPKWVKKKLRLRGWDPPGEIRAEILRRFPVAKSQMVPRRPIWRQKSVIWGPLGFRAALAHLWAVPLPPGWVPPSHFPSFWRPNLEVDCSESRYSRSRSP